MSATIAKPALVGTGPAAAAQTVSVYGASG
jgi:hypothetical protein